MTVCRRISIFSRSASTAALRSGRTLKPTMIALEAIANNTSDSEMAPTPERSNWTCTFSLRSLRRVSSSTSSDPCTSALSTIGSSLTSPRLRLSWNCSSESRELLAICSWRSFSSRNSTTLRALSMSAGDDELVARLRRVLEPQHDDGRGRTGFGDLLPLVVEQRAHAPEHRADQEVVADPQRAVLNDHRGHGSLTAIELGFEHGARGQPIRVGLELAQIRNEQHHLQKLIDVLALDRGDVDEDRVAAPLLRHQAAIGELLLDPVGLRIGLVNLVDGDDHRHLGRFGVVDRLERLRHHAVVGGDDQDD